MVSCYGEAPVVLFILFFMPDGVASKDHTRPYAESRRELAIRWIEDAVRGLPLDAEGAWWLADREHFDALVAKLAVFLAGKTETVLDLKEEEFLGLIRARLEMRLGAMMNTGERNEGTRVPGMDLIPAESEPDLWLDFGLANDWRAPVKGELLNSNGFACAEEMIGGARLLEGLNVSFGDRHVLTQLMLPIVVRSETGEYVFRRRKPNGEIGRVSRYTYEKAEYALSEIVRASGWPRPHQYRYEYARYLEAVLLSSLPQAEKERFVGALLRVKVGERPVQDYRPGYGGKNDVRLEEVIWIALPTGEKLEIVDGRELRVKEYRRYEEYDEDDREEEYATPTDAVFLMALAERGTIPVSALDAIYRVREQGNRLSVHVIYPYPQATPITLDFSKPFNRYMNLPAIYAAFLLTRDPRISEGMRLRLRRYFEKRATVTVSDGWR